MQWIIFVNVDCFRVKSACENQQVQDPANHHLALVSICCHRGRYPGSILTGIF